MATKTENELRAEAAKKNGKKITHGTWNKNPGNIKGFNGSGGKNSYAKWLDKKGIKYTKGTEAHDGGFFIKFENNNDGLYAKANFWNVAKSWSAYKKDGKPMTVSEAVQTYSGAQYNDDGTQKKGTGYQQSFLDNIEKNGIDLSAPIDSLSSDSLILLSNFQMQTEDPNQYRTLQKDGLITEDGQFNYEGAPTSTGTSSPKVEPTGTVDEETNALLTSLKTATDESSGKRSYTVTKDDLKIVDGAEKNIREFYISEYSDKSLDDDDLMMGGDGSSDKESIFDKISTELSSDLDMQTERGQAIFKARLESYEEKVTSPEYVDNLRSTYQGPSLRTPLTNDMAYTNIVQDTNFRIKVLGQSVQSAMKQNDVVIETRDFDAQGKERGVEENLGKIPGTNQDAITTAQIIAKKLAKQGNKELADLLMQEGGSELAGQYILDEIAKQSLNKDEQGKELNFENLNKNLTTRITDPDGYAEKTGQTDINQNSKNLLISVEDQDRLNQTKDNQALAKQAQEAQKNNDTKVFDDYKAYEEWVSKDPKRAEKRKGDPEGLYKEFTNKDAVEEQNKQKVLSQQEKDERRTKRMRNAEKVLSGLKAAAGVLSLSKAMQDPEIDIPEISPLVMEAVEKQRAMSKSGLTSKEKNAAMQNMNDAYAGAMKNVLRASGGQRGMFLANQGTVDAQRIQGLNQLAAQDAALHRQNIGQYNQLASSVGQMKLQRDMTAEQMKQAAIQQNKQMLGGIGSNLVSDAMSDLSWYMNPNRDLIEKAQRTSLEGMLGDSSDNTYDADDGYEVGGNNLRAKETPEQKAEKARQKQIDDLNKI